MLAPFEVKKSWYDEYWYSNPAPRVSTPMMAARLASLFALVLAGLRGLGHH